MIALTELDETAAYIRERRPHVVAGPWMTEPGFELLYWIPFLGWLVREAEIAPERLTVLSRGGCASWYRHLTQNYRDVFEHVPPEGFIDLNQERMVEGGQAFRQTERKPLRRRTAKHLAVANREHALLDAVCDRDGLGDAVVVHPSLMYHAFDVFWRGQVGHETIAAYTVAPPELAPETVLPVAPYVAVRFYANSCLSANPAVVKGVNRLVGALAARLPVLVLGSGARLDDHADIPIEARPNVTHLDIPDVATNLHTQTEAIRHATALVSTYGGFSYLGPLLGVDTLAVFQTDDFNKFHLTRAEKLLEGRASYQVLGLEGLTLTGLPDRPLRGHAAEPAIAHDPHTARRRMDAHRGRPVAKGSYAPPAPAMTEATALQTLMDGRRVLVVGSAPLPTPLVVEPGEVVVAVNGAVSSVPHVDVWFVNSRTKPLDRWSHQRRFLHTTMISQGAHRHVGTVAYLTRMPLAENYTHMVLTRQGTTFTREVVVGRDLRERIETESGIRTIAMRQDACSAGMFAVIVALWCGAASVRMAGFSFEKGYAYLPGYNLPPNARAHVHGDRLSLREMRTKYPGRISGALIDG